MSRTKALCPHWDECGGCPLIRMDYKKQLQHKNDKVAAAFVKAGFERNSISRILKPTRPSPQTLGYRNKAKWILQTDSHGELKMGIYAPGTHEVIDIPHCAVHAPMINEVSMFLKQRLIQEGVRCSNETGSSPRLRYCIVRYSFREKKLILVLVTSHEKVTGLDRVVQQLTAKFGDRVVSVVQNINADEGNVLLGEANRFLKKSGELTESMGPYRVPVGPLSFLQVNSGQASYLYKRVKELIGRGPHKTGLDLYSGVGLIAMHLATSTKKILAVEEVGPAALEAITAARRNRLHNILNLCSDALEGISTFGSEWGAPDWVVLNPPRKGCDEAVLQALSLKAPKRLVYVSCNPATLARDLQLLLKAVPGFQLKTIEPVDMFPQTEHVECIALLENVSSSRPTVEGNPSRKKNSKLSSEALH
jgi:23S rRNA (uracil1939-C5)-methyltransferase